LSYFRKGRVYPFHAHCTLRRTAVSFWKRLLDKKDRWAKGIHGDRKRISVFSIAISGISILASDFADWLIGYRQLLNGVWCFIAISLKTTDQQSMSLPQWRHRSHSARLGSI